MSWGVGGLMKEYEQSYILQTPMIHLLCLQENEFLRHVAS